MWASDSDEELCDFLEAGPLLTPGLRPVWVLGELDPLLLPLDEDEEEDVEDCLRIEAGDTVDAPVMAIWLDELDP